MEQRENRLVISTSRHNSDSSMRAVRILEQDERRRRRGGRENRLWEGESVEGGNRCLPSFVAWNGFECRAETRPDSPFRAACFDTPPIHHLRFDAAASATGEINFVERIAAHDTRSFNHSNHAGNLIIFENFRRESRFDSSWLDSSRDFALVWIGEGDGEKGKEIFIYLIR